MSRSASVTSSHSKTNTAPGWLVVRTQIELPHLVDLVALPHAAGLFAYVRGDVFPPDPTSRMPIASTFTPYTPFFAATR